MIDSILDWLDPHIADVLWYLVIVPILDRIRWIYKTKESRDALHSALRTGVNKITDLLVPVILANPIGFKLDQYAGMVANHVFNSVPDALKFLLGKSWFMQLLGKKPMTEAEQREWIEGMAKAALNEWASDFIAKLRPDELTEALKKAGAPAVEPWQFIPQFADPVR